MHVKGNISLLNVFVIWLMHFFIFILIISYLLFPITHVYVCVCMCVCRQVCICAYVCMCARESMLCVSVCV